VDVDITHGQHFIQPHQVVQTQIHSRSCLFFESSTHHWSKQPVRYVLKLQPSKNLLSQDILQSHHAQKRMVLRATAHRTSFRIANPSICLSVVRWDLCLECRLCSVHEESGSRRSTKGIRFDVCWPRRGPGLFSSEVEIARQVSPCV
jgi:hypothetical protein